MHGRVRALDAFSRSRVADGGCAGARVRARGLAGRAHALHTETLAWILAVTHSDATSARARASVADQTGPAGAVSRGGAFRALAAETEWRARRALVVTRASAVSAVDIGATPVGRARAIGATRAIDAPAV